MHTKHRLDLYHARKACVKTLVITLPSLWSPPTNSLHFHCRSPGSLQTQFDRFGNFLLVALAFLPSCSNMRKSYMTLHLIPLPDFTTNLNFFISVVADRSPSTLHSSLRSQSKQVEEDQAFFALVRFGPKENISAVLHVKSPSPHS